MVDQTENHQLDSELTLHDSSQCLLTVRAIALTLIKRNEQIIECRFTFQVTPELYQRIDTEALFNLKPEVRSPFPGGKFLAEPDISITVTLQPDLLPQLLEKAKNPEQAATYLLNLSQQFSDNPENSVNKPKKLSKKSRD